jgi:hypothetical protein
MFLQVRTAAHVGAEAWAASFCWCIGFGHVDMIPRLWTRYLEKVVDEVGDRGVESNTRVVRTEALA